MPTRPATAPAQRVEITDQLPGELDWSSLRFTEAGFGDVLITVPEGLQYYFTTVEMTYNDQTFDVEVELEFNAATGIVRAVFQSIDPDTSLPPDVLTGFLPPEDGNGAGKGHIGFTVQARPDLPTGTEIRNIALITFDFQELIATNQVDPQDPSQGTDPNLEALNTIDAGAPASSVLQLPATSGLATFLVSWAGTDDADAATGSGIATFDVFVSVNGGPFDLWLDDMPDASALYAGANGNTYSFYSVATDNVGHVEAAPPTADTTTQVQVVPTTIYINDYSLLEGNAGITSFVFTVSLSNPSETAVTVDFATADGTATLADGDYQQTSGQLSFSPGTTTQLVTVVIQGDTQFESDETFFVNLAEATNATIDGAQSTGTIINDDEPFVVPRTSLVTGDDAGGGSHVRVLEPGTLNERFGFFAYPGFTGGVRVATGDVNFDGVDDIVTAAGPGGGPHVRVFDGTTGQQLPGTIGSFYAYDAAFSGGVYVAAGDVNADGYADVITGAGAGGGPHVRAFSGLDGTELFGFFAYVAEFTGGVSVAAGDIDADGRADVITGAGAGGGPHVRAFSGATGQQVDGAIGSFFAYNADFAGGVYVAAGDVDADGRADVISGAGAGGGPHVRVFSGNSGAELFGFFAYAAEFSGGVRVGAGDLNGDGRADVITGAGPGGGPHARAFNSVDQTGLESFNAYSAAFTGGIFVAGAPTQLPGPALRYAQDATAASQPAPPASQEQLQRIRDAALARWQDAGATPADLDRLSRVRVELAALPGNGLGLARASGVLMDANAAGRGWFIDPTPEEDKEFSSAGAAATPAAIDRVDLLTALLHEFGHVLGLQHAAAGSSGDLMADELPAGQRRLPAARHVDEVFTGL